MSPWLFCPISIHKVQEKKTHESLIILSYLYSQGAGEKDSWVPDYFVLSLFTRCRRKRLMSPWLFCSISICINFFSSVNCFHNCICSPNSLCFVVASQTCPQTMYVVGATRGVTVSMSAFLTCHQCYCAGSSLAWGLNIRAVVCGIFLSLSPGVFSGYSGFLPSFIGLMVQPIK